MATPISNDKILPSDGASGTISGKKRADQETATQTNTSGDAISKDENGSAAGSVDVERANRIFNSSTPKHSSGEDVITNPEHARAVAAEIRTQIEGNAMQALKAQTGSGTSGLSVLLETAPA